MPISTAGPGTILLGGKLLRLRGSKGEDGILQTQELGTFPRKVTIGDHSKDSQDFRSTWIINDLSGGHGVAYHTGDATVNRYRSSTLDVSRPGSWTQRYVAPPYTGTAGTFVPLGDLLYSGNIEMYGAFGTDLHIWNESTDAWTDTTSNLAAAPVNNGVAFAGTGTLRLFIPLGTTGYDTYTGAAHASVAASGSTPAAREFVVFSQMLICLDTSNQLWWTTDGTTWTSYGVDGKIDSSYTAYRVDSYRDGMDNPTIVISTTGGVWVFDPGGPTLYQQDLTFPAHPDQGRAACVWRGTYYVSVGMGVHAWASHTGTISAIGLDRDDGLAYNHSGDGYIADMFPAYNEMYAIVQATNVTVQRWTGLGWHEVWNEVGTDDASKLYVSQARATYRVWWGTGNESFSINLPKGFTNPKKMTVETATNNLDPSSTGAHELLTGMNDMQMSGYRKIAHSAKLRVGFLRADSPNGTNIATLQYRTNESAAWVSLNEPAGIDHTPITDALDYTTIDYWFNSDRTGVPFDEIELRLELKNQYVVAKFLTMDFIKIPRLNRSWTAVVDLQSSFDDENPEDLLDHISDLVSSETITTMVHRDVTYYVRVASWNAAENTGFGDDRSVVNLQIIEMRYEENT
jgi:hypothetical protein